MEKRERRRVVIWMRESGDPSMKRRGRVGVLGSRTAEKTIKPRVSSRARKTGYWMRRRRKEGTNRLKTR